MKKLSQILITLLAVVALHSCNSSDISDLSNVPEQQTASLSQKRTVDEAIDLAIKAKANFYPTISRSDISVDRTKIHYLKNRRLSRGAAADTLFYVINFADDDGYAIINAQKSGVDVIAVTESGEYDPESEDNNTPPALDLYLKNTILLPGDSLLIRPIDSISTLLEQIVVRDTLQKVFVEPKVKTRWGQGSFFGTYCPNSIVGCGPLALGQSIVALGSPTTMNFTFTNKTRPFDSTTFNWADIIKHNTLKSSTAYCENAFSDDSDCTYNHKQIAALLRELGLRSNASYGMYSTGVTFNGLLAAAQSLNFKIINGLDGKTSTPICPITSHQDAIFIMGAFDVDSEEGHIFIVDGCKYWQVKETTYTRYQNTSNLNYEGSTTYSTEYVHINWGWYGSSNGYFYTTTKPLDTSKPSYQDYSDISNASLKYTNFSYFGIYL